VRFLAKIGAERIRRPVPWPSLKPCGASQPPGWPAQALAGALAQPPRGRPVPAALLRSVPQEELQRELEIQDSFLVFDFVLFH